MLKRKGWRTMACILLLLLSLLSVVLVQRSPQAHAASAMTLYVAPNGNDTWSGTLPSPNAGGTDGPFATIAHARDAVRSLKNGISGDIQVQLRGGVYPQTSTLTFDETDSGADANHRIIYMAYPGEHPVISGGYRITSTWTKVPGQNYYQATLPSSISDFRELYVNGERKIRATTGTPLVAEDWYHDPSDTTYTEDGFIVDSALLPQTFTRPQDMQIHTHVEWRDFWLPVKNIVPNTNGTTTIIFQQPYFYEATQYLTPQYERVNPLFRFTLENALELVVQQREWYFNKDTHTLYYYPVGNADPNNADTEIPQVEEIVSIKGSSFDTPVHDLLFQGLTFQYSSWLAPSTEGFYGYQSEWLERPHGPDNSYLTHTVPSAVLIDAASAITFDRNIVRHTGGTGIGIYFGVSATTISGNVIYDTSDAGISVGHPYGGTIDQPWKKLTSQITVKDNVLRDTGREYYGAGALSAYYVDALTITHNDIADVPYSAVEVLTNGNYGNLTITSNKVDTFLTRLNDGGAYYVYGPGNSQNGGVISNNYATTSFHDQAGIYLDQQSSNYTVTSNVIEQPYSSWLFTQNDSQNNTISNNYATTSQQVVQGTNNTVSGTTVYALSSRPSGAQDILNQAGLESSYAGILARLPGSPNNGAPSVHVPASFTINLDQTLRLGASVKDDGYPTYFPLQVTWSEVSGPGSVTFGDIGVANTTAAFAVAGAYTLQISASDGQKTTTKTVTVTVNNVTLPANVALNGIASAPNSYTAEPGNPDKYLPLRAIDGDITTGWAPSGGPEWWQVDLKLPYAIHRIEIVTRQDDGLNFPGVNNLWQVKASNDPSFATYTLIGSQGVDDLIYKSTWTVNFSDATGYRYVRIEKAVQGGNGLFVSEFRVFGVSTVTTQALSDRFNDWSLTASHTSNLGIDTGGGNYGGVPHTVFKTDGNVASIIYQQSNLTGFIGTFYYQEYSVSSSANLDANLTVYASSDGVNWTAVTLIHDTPLDTTGGWRDIHYNASSMPTGTAYLKVELENNYTNWAIHIAEVDLLSTPS